MQFYSTNKKSPLISLREAVLKGLAPDGGLFMPETIPRLPLDFFETLHTRALPDMAFEVAKHFVGQDIPDQDLRRIVEEAINFDAPLIKLSGNIEVLELFHGPTLAFKDFGARFMARLMSYLIETEEQDLIILVATSGDTGSAVANGFYNVPHTRVVILYPSGKVSSLQEKQLTAMGGNVTALEIQGVFDDCQRLAR